MATSERIVLTSGGPEFSRIIPGLMRLVGWGMSDAELLDWIKACLDMGVTTFDHADIYGGHRCEALFGQALALEPSIRQKIEIVTKCDIKPINENRPAHWINHYDTSHEHIIWSTENSLKNFGTDYLDLLLIHRPDPLMDADEIAGAFHVLKQQGKVRYFGVSNFSPSQFELLQARLDFPLVTNQVEFSPLYMNPMHDGTFDQLQRLRVAPMIWSPLGGGEIFRATTEQAGRLNAALRDIAADLGENIGIDQVIIAWTLMHPVRVLPVLGTGKLDRIQAAVEALEFKLNRQQWFSVWQASKGHSVP